MSLLPMYGISAVALPGERIWLRFESRAEKQILQDIKGGTPLGLLTIDGQEYRSFGYIAKPSGKENKYSDGVVELEVEVGGVFRLTKFYDRHPLKLYPAGIILEIALDIYAAETALINAFRQYAYRYLPKDKLPAELTGNLFELARFMGLTNEQKYTFITLFNSVEMNRLLRNIIRTKSALINQELKLHGQFFLN